MAMADRPVPVSADAATRERRDEWKRLAEAATEGPWFEAGREYDDDNIWIWAKDTDGGAPFEVALGALPSDQADQDYDNAAFIAAAREAVPDLIAQVEALESERSVLAAKIQAVEALIAGAKSDGALGVSVWLVEAALVATEETK